MSPKTDSVLYWAPRAVGLAATLFLALFALDAFDGQPLGRAILAFAIHLLPAAVCGAVVAIAWRYPLAGAVMFGLLAMGYALSVPTHPDWIAVISGPLALTAVLFAISPRRRRPAAART